MTNYETVSANDFCQVFRYPVPGGWIYETRFLSATSPHIALSTVFVPEPKETL